MPMQVPDILQMSRNKNMLIYIYIGSSYIIKPFGKISLSTEEVATGLVLHSLGTAILIDASGSVEYARNQTPEVLFLSVVGQKGN